MKVLKDILLIFIITIIFFLGLSFFIVFSFHTFEKFYDINYVEQEIFPEGMFTTEENFPFKNLHLYSSFFPRTPIKQKHYRPDKTLEFNVKMNISPIASRVDLFRDNDANKHLIIAGDSHTFGVGLEDEKVYSNLLAKEYDNIQVYNFAHMGWSPASTYLFFDPDLKENFQVEKYVKEKQGIFFYLYFPALSERDYGSADVLRYTLALIPYYKREGDELKVQGRFKDSFKFSHLRLMGLLGMHLFWDRKVVPLFYDSKEVRRKRYEKSAMIFSKMQESYLKRFPGSHFYVGICSLEFIEALDLEVNKVFKEYGIEFLDLRSKEFCTNQEEYYFTEHHLNDKAHLKIKDIIQSKIINDNRDLMFEE